MASTSRSTVESLDSKPDPTKDSPTSAKGPPPASPKPRSASDSSLYSTVGKEGMTSGASGLGAEGSSPALTGMQGLALVQRGLQMLNLAFPDNPGLVAILADLTGRLQSLIPQLIAQSAGGAGQGMGMMGPAMQQQPGMQPPMGAPAGPAPGGPPQGPPMPPM